MKNGAAVRKALRVMLKTMKWTFIVFCVYLGSLFFREERIPGSWAERVLDGFLPPDMMLHLGDVSFGFRHGLHVRDLRVYDLSQKDVMTPVISADLIGYVPFFARLRIEGLKYVRLPSGYYESGNHDRDERVEASLPEIGRLSVTLIRSDILGICPESLTFDVESTPTRVDFRKMHLVWPDRDERMEVDGFCYVDLDRQEVYGEVDGLARQAHIRPLLVAIDVPVALPYMDGFTDVPEPCPSKCAWKVDLVRNDFDLWLELHPVLGKYNTVPMRKADGKIHVHNCTRDNCLNYVTTVGPITGTDVEGRYLDGTVVIVGTNGHNTVTVDARSSQPLADVLKIGGFTGDYVGNDVFGESECKLVFDFPRCMDGNYEVLNGSGHVTVRNGRLMRMKGFKGLIDAMPSIAPAITWFSDSTQASGDYVISNGVVRTDNAYIEGSLFSIKMYGWLDTVRNEQDFTVRVQFAKSDSLVGKLLHPLAWPFTKLLLEFRLTGSPEEPKWKYISVIDRVVEAVK